MRKKLKSENAKNERLLCENDIIILLPTTFGCWYIFPRVGNLFFANGCSNETWCEWKSVTLQGKAHDNKLHPNIQSTLQQKLCIDGKVYVNTLDPYIGDD
jgi:hypothetical protein